MDIEVFNGIDEPYGDFDSDMNFGSYYNYMVLNSGMLARKK